MALNSLCSADVPLRNYTLTHDTGIGRQTDTGYKTPPLNK